MYFEWIEENSESPNTLRVKENSLDQSVYNPRDWLRMAECGCGTKDLIPA